MVPRGLPVARVTGPPTASLRYSIVGRLTQCGHPHIGYYRLGAIARRPRPKASNRLPICTFARLERGKCSPWVEANLRANLLHRKARTTYTDSDEAQIEGAVAQVFLSRRDLLGVAGKGRSPPHAWWSTAIQSASGRLALLAAQVCMRASQKKSLGQ